jgi:hypothetical protein
MVELYFYSPIRLHGVVLNLLSRGRILPLPLEHNTWEYIIQYVMFQLKVDLAALNGNLHATKKIEFRYKFKGVGLEVTIDSD